MSSVLRTALRPLATSVATLLFTASAFAQAGPLDTGFNTTGEVMTNFNTVNAYSSGRGIVVQTNASGVPTRIVVGGNSFDNSFNHLCVVGIRPTGGLDGSFGTGGYTRRTTGVQDTFNDLAIDSGNNIYGGGYSNNQTVERTVVAKFLPNGTFDNAFGSTGVATIAVAGGPNGLDRTQRIAVQPDGKVLIVGFGKFFTEAGFSLIVARLNTNGTLDTTFGPNATGKSGRVILHYNSPGATAVGTTWADAAVNLSGTNGFGASTNGFRGWSIALQKDGKIVVGGDVRAPGSVGYILARLNTGGTLDNTFGGDGVIFESFNNGNCGALATDDLDGDGTTDVIYALDRQSGAFRIDRYRASDGSKDSASWAGKTGVFTSTALPATVTPEMIKVEPNHKLVVGGEAGAPSAGASFIARVLADGSGLDTSFNGTGYNRSATMGDFSRAIAFYPDPPNATKYVEVGTAFSSTVNNAMSVGRFTSGGAFDTTFNTTGYLVADGVNGLQGGSYDEANGIGVDASGNIIAVGNTGAPYNFAIARYSTAGVLDQTFNTTGKAEVDFSTFTDRAYGVAVDSSNRPVAVGNSVQTNSTLWAVARLTTAGATDFKVTTAMGNGSARGVAIQPDDQKIVVVGSASVAGVGSSFGIARYTSAGALDTAFNSSGTRTFGAGGVAEARAVTVVGTGATRKIIVVGKSTLARAAQPNISDSRFTIIQLTDSGAFDANFGTGGVVNVTLDTPAIDPNTSQPHIIIDEANAVVVDPSGYIYVGGRTGDTQFSRTSFGVVRLLPNGTLDTSWGTNGIVKTAYGTDNQDQIQTLRLQYDEKPLAFGASQTLMIDTARFSIARYDFDNGSLDASFGTAGKVKLSSQSYNVSGVIDGFVYTSGSLIGKMHMAGALVAGDFYLTRHLGDSSPTALPTTAPDLVPASDSGRSNSDNITFDNTPTFVGGGCTNENAIFIEVNGALTVPRGRAICRSGAWTATMPTMADGTYTINAFAATGKGRVTSANGSTATTTMSITVDTVALPPTISVPAANFEQDYQANLTVSGAGAEKTAFITVKEGTTTLCSATATSNNNNANTWSCSFAASTLTLGQHTLSVTQEDIAGNVSLPPATVVIFVKAQTTTAIVPTPSQSVYGQPVSFLATVTSVPTGVGSPDASVNILVAPSAAQSFALASSSAVASSATLTTAALSVGNHAYSASYPTTPPGSTKFFPSSTPVGTFTVLKADTTTAVSSSSNPSVFGQGVTFTITVSAVAPGAGVPSGNIKVFVDGAATPTFTVALSAAPPNSATVTTPALSSLSVADHSIVVTYVGDGNFNPSSGSPTSGPTPGSQTVNKASTTSTVTASPAGAVFGQTVTIVNQVAVVSPGAGSPAGTAAFTEGAASLGSGTLNGTFAASTTTSSLAAGPHTFTSSYQGDGNFLQSTANSASFTVAKASTTLGVSGAAGTTVVGESFSVSATMSVVSPGTGVPAGTVTVTDGVNTCTISLAGGTGNCSLALVTAGPRTITASYSGDANFATSSATSPHTVNASPTTTTIATHTPDPSQVGLPVTVTYSVVAAAPGAGTPTGNVTVSDGVDSCSGTVAAGQCTVVLTTPGTRTLTVTYAGTASYLTSSATTSHVVKRPTTTTITQHTPDPSDVSTALTVQFQVATTVGTPTGSVTITAGADSCTGTLSGSPAVGQCSITLNTLGAQTLVATYSGDSSYETSIGSASHTVKANTTTSITGAQPSTSVTGEGVVISYTVAVVAPGTGTATGNVTISDGTFSCTGTVAAGQCSIAFPAAGTHVLTAAYAGDAQYSGSTAATPLSFVVRPASTVFATLSAAPNPSMVGSSVSVSWSLAVAAPGFGTPTGNVTVSDGADSCSAPVAAGGCSIVLNTAGARTLSAAYPGDANFTSTSATISQSVRADTTITITAPAPTVTGQSATISWSVAVVAPGSGTPTGTVTITDGTSSCSGDVGNGSCSITFSSAETHNLTASYSGDTDFNSSNTAASTPYTVNKAQTTAAISSADPQPSAAGAPVLVVFTVAPASPGAGTPTGTVTVTAGTDTCSATVAQGQCTIVLSHAGPISLTAVYAGDSDFEASSSSAFAHTVNRAATTTVVTTSVTPSEPASNVTFTATVTSGATGNVTFSNGAVVLATVALTGNTASFDTTQLAPGSHSITTAYVGDTNFEPSTSAALSQTVNKAGTTTSITARTPSASVTGQTITVNFSVASTFGTVEGDVTVTDGTSTCTGSVAAGQCTLTFATAGAKSLTASYSGNASHSVSSSAAVDHQVTAGSTLTTITGQTPSPSVVGEPVSVSWSVVPTSNAAGAPTGTVTISDGSASCSAAVTAGACALTFNAPGERTLTATYSGDADFTSSASAGAVHQIGKGNVVVTIVSRVPDRSVVNTPTTVSFGVLAAAPAAGTPEGSVTVTDGVTSCTATVTQGSCSLTFPTTGAHSLTATYAGDTNFNVGTSAAVSHIVSNAVATVAVSSTPLPSVASGEVTLSGHVTVVAQVNTVPTGTLTFSKGSTILGTATLDGTGRASISTAVLGKGENQILVTYGGDDRVDPMSVNYVHMVASVTVECSSVVGGTAVTVRGARFQSGATVTFGGAAGTNVTFVNDTTINATVPAHVRGVVDVVVTNPDNSVVNMPGTFTYIYRGDSNGDCLINPSDIFYLINHLFTDGPLPVGLGDANGDGQVNVSDIFFLINFLFVGGEAPE